MGGGDPRPPSDNAEYTPRSDDSDEFESDVDDLTWSPGDGICPSTAQFNACYKSRFSRWRNASSSTHKKEEFVSFSSYLRVFLDLFKHVPPFFCSPPEGVHITGRPGSHLVLKSAVQIQTTKDPDCDQPYKLVYYLQCLGSPAPVVYRTKAETQPLQIAIPVSAERPLRSGYFTSIVLAWSYIVSCRWVEILQAAGEKSQICHGQKGRLEDCFWDIVTQGCWVAQIHRQNGVFYSPWMMRREGTTKENRNNYICVPPNSALAFDILLDYCVSEGLEGELLTGLASVLILTSRNAPPPKFAPPMRISASPIRFSSTQKKNMGFHELFQSIDKYMFLSSTQDGLDSLLCSALFDPSVPCTLLGAASLGVREALLSTDQTANQQLLNGNTSIKPHLSLLWAAALCNDQANSFLNLALRSLPPICLVAALWTNTTQSFLQVEYCSNEQKETIIPRANEFKTSYYCRPDIPVPWSPAPPFGSTPVDNLSLEVRAHLPHMHRPVSWTMYWILKDSGERSPGSARHELELEQVDNVDCPGSEGHADSPTLPHPERETADEQSGAATSRLFNWHRSYDDGIWLDDGKSDIDLIRQLQRHAWIIDQFDSQDDEPVEEPNQSERRVESILRWTNNMEEYRRSGGLLTP